MKDISADRIFATSSLSSGQVNQVILGTGLPVVLLHGIAASLHDWDALLPELKSNGYAAYALDLLGHGASAKPNSRAYHIDWILEHFRKWMDGLNLNQPAVLIGHSLGGYLALDFALRYPGEIKCLVLSNPLYKPDQLSKLLRMAYRRPGINSLIFQRAPQWLWRLIIDMTSVSLGRTGGSFFNLPENVRRQTALDYKKTAPGVYNLPNTLQDLSDRLSKIDLQTLVIWGDRDQTLEPDSFKILVQSMPHAEGRAIIGAGHVVHQSHSNEFNQNVLEFLHRVITAHLQVATIR